MPKEEEGEVKEDRVERVGPKEEAERTACCGGKRRRGHMRTHTATPLVSLAPPPSPASCHKIHCRTQKNQARLLVHSLKFFESTLWVYALFTCPLHSKLACHLCRKRAGKRPTDGPRRQLAAPSIFFHSAAQCTRLASGSGQR